MERFSLGDDVAFVPRGDLLDRVTVAPLTRPMFEGSPFQAAVFRFEPGGRSMSYATPGRSPSTIRTLLRRGVLTPSSHERNSF